MHLLSRWFMQITPPAAKWPHGFIWTSINFVLRSFVIWTQLHRAMNENYTMAAPDIAIKVHKIKGNKLDNQVIRGWSNLLAAHVTPLLLAN
jgi:hypothetical protein